ncbi:MAG: chemotaxis protein CheD [Spirochaetota bacterium]
MGHRTVIVKMAEMDVVESTPSEPVSLKTTLGSCVGIILAHAKSGLHGLAHIMLPERLREDPATGKYADTAIPELLRMMEARGARRGELKALLVGGANMFEFSGKNGASLIGEKNVEAVKKVLDDLGIPVVFEETGGNSGRTVLYHARPGNGSGKSSEAGSLEIRTLAQIRPLRKTGGAGERAGQSKARRVGG